MKITAKFEDGVVKTLPFKSCRRHYTSERNPEVPSDLVMMCKSCNRFKYAKDMLEHAKKCHFGNKKNDVDTSEDNDDDYDDDDEKEAGEDEEDPSDENLDFGLDDEKSSSYWGNSSNTVRNRREDEEPIEIFIEKFKVYEMNVTSRESRAVDKIWNRFRSKKSAKKKKKKKAKKKTVYEKKAKSPTKLNVKTFKDSKVCPYCDYEVKNWTFDVHVKVCFSLSLTHTYTHTQYIHFNHYYRHVLVPWDLTLTMRQT